MNVVQERLGEAGWASGVVPATDSTLLPDTAAQSGKNSALALATAGSPFVQKRMGMQQQNDTPMSSSPAVIGIFSYGLNDGSSQRILVGDNGTLQKLNDDGSLTILSSSLTAGANYPQFQTALGNLFLCNGHDYLKYDGTNVTKWGITRPTVGTMSGAAGAAGSPSGTYELRVSYANTLTGTESSASDTATATVTVTNQKIVVSNVPVSGDSQVNARFLYVRNTATMGQFYRAGTISDNSTTSITLDFLDANLTIAAPTTTSNNPPPTGIKYAAWHLGRMFVATDTQLFYSNINRPEAFDPLNEALINPQDGQLLTALFSDHEILEVFKSDSLWGIFNGNDPTTWDILKIDSDYGCENFRTVVAANGWTYFWSRHGIARWAGAGTVDPIGTKLYGDPSTTVNGLQIAVASAARDELNNRYLIALPGTGQTRATFILPLNTLLGVLESEAWDPMDAASLGSILHSGVPSVYLGNYAGQVFQMWNSNNDGLPSGSTFQGFFVAGGTSISSFTDSSAAFTTTGGMLIERKLTIKDANGNVVSPTEPRLHVSTNTATAITLSATLSGLTNGATYYYEIAGPDFSWTTPWRTFSLPWTKKRLEFLWILTKSATYGTSGQVDLDFDYDEANSNGKRRSFQTTGGQGQWDAAIWDQDIWDVSGQNRQRFRVGRTGFAWRSVLRNSAPNQPFAFLGVAVQAITQTTKG